MKDMKKKIFRVIDSFNMNNRIKHRTNAYIERFIRFSFVEGQKCDNAQQYEAVITRLYHTIEKGLSYLNYRPGFGKDNVKRMIQYMQWYEDDGYSIEAFFYRTALSTLQEYISKNRAHDHNDQEIEECYKKLRGEHNVAGGIIAFDPLDKKQIQKLGFKDFLQNRHSIRHFSSLPVNMDDLKEAIELAQSTPSACNRQGWRTIILDSRDSISAFLKIHSGCRGFGDEFNKVLIVTTDLRYSNRSREIFQAYIDGGMYAQNLINALHYYHIATVPLSASLTLEQESELRTKLKLNEWDVPIVFIGIGNYPEKCQTTKSTRKNASIQMI